MNEHRGAEDKRTTAWRRGVIDGWLGRGHSVPSFPDLNGEDLRREYVRGYRSAVRERANAEALKANTHN